MRQTTNINLVRQKNTKEVVINQEGSLCLKRAQVQNLSCENDFFYYHENKTHFHKEGFALGLVLRGGFLELGNGQFNHLPINHWLLFFPSAHEQCVKMMLEISAGL